MTDDVGERERPPLRCRIFGHKCGPFMTRGFRVIVTHHCKRCGWVPDNDHLAPSQPTPEENHQ